MKSKAILLAAALAIVVPFGVANARDAERTPELEPKTTRVNEVEKEIEVETEKEHTTTELSEAAKERVQQARDDAKAQVEQAREAAKERKIAVKQDRCETRKTKLTELIPRLSNSVTTIQGVLDAKYAKVQAIVASGKLTVDNYDELNANIAAKQAGAQTAIASANLSTVTIDCNDNSLGIQLDTFRTSLNEAKAALKEYRTALVKLISALNAAADKAEVSTAPDTTASVATEGAN